MCFEGFFDVLNVKSRSSLGLALGFLVDQSEVCSIIFVSAIHVMVCITGWYMGSCVLVSCHPVHTYVNLST